MTQGNCGDITKSDSEANPDSLTDVAVKRVINIGESNFAKQHPVMFKFVKCCVEFISVYMMFMIFGKYIVGLGEVGDA